MKSVLLSFLLSSVSLTDNVIVLQVDMSMNYMFMDDEVQTVPVPDENGTVPQ